MTGCGRSLGVQTLNVPWVPALLLAVEGLLYAVTVSLASTSLACISIS